MSDNGRPVFQQVYYLNPFASMPPGWTQTGVVVSVDNPSDPTGLVLAGRLRLDTMEIMVELGATPTLVRLLPAAPLSATGSYAVDVQWVPAGTDPANINWSNTAITSTSPVVTAYQQLVSGQIAAGALRLAFEPGAGGTVPTGANLMVFDGQGRSVGFSRVEGNDGDVAFSPQAGTAYTLYLQGVMPIAGSGTGTFAAPYTMGPVSSGAPLPTAAPTLSAVSYDGDAVRVDWQAAAPVANAGPGSFLLVAQGADGSLVEVPAGPTGGSAAIGAVGAEIWTVAGMAVQGRVAGPAGTGVEILAQVSTVSGIEVAAGRVTATVGFPPGVAGGTQAEVWLYAGGQVLAGPETATQSAATVSFAQDVLGRSDVAVRARLTLASSGVPARGPLSAAATAATVAPAIVAVATMADPSQANRWLVEVSWEPPPAAAVSWSSATASISQAGTPVASQTVTSGCTARFTLTQGTAGEGTLDGSQVASVEVSLATAAATSPAATATFVCAAPTITAVQNIQAGDPSGLPMGIQIDTSAGVADQVLAVRLLAEGLAVAESVGGGSSHAQIPLIGPLDPTLAFTVQARWTGNGVDDSTYGGWSQPVAVLTSVTQVLAASYDGAAVLCRVGSPAGVYAAQGVYAFAYDAAAHRVTGASFPGTEGSFALSAGSGTWQIGAKPYVPLAGAGAQSSVAPASELVPLLTVAPALTALGYDGTWLTASWTVVQDAAGNDATWAVLEILDGSGVLASVPVGSDRGVVAIALDAADQGSLQARVRASRGAIEGPFSAAQELLVSLPVVSGVEVTGGQVTAAVAAPPGAPAGTVVRGWIRAGGTVVAGPVDADGSALTFAFDAAGAAGLSVVAQGYAPGSPSLSGPLGLPVPVLGRPPTLRTVLIETDSEDASKWSIAATWDPAQDPQVTGYELALMQGTTVVAQGQGASLSVAKADIDPANAYAVAVTALGIGGSRSPAAEQAVLFTGPLLAATAFTGSAVTANWTAPSATGDLTELGYAVAIYDSATGAEVFRSPPVGALTASLPMEELPLASDGSYAAGLLVVSGALVFDPGSDGTAKTRAPILLGAVDGFESATDAVSGAVTLGWTALAGAAGYRVQIGDAPPVTVASASYALPSPPQPNQRLAVRIAADASQDGVTAAGAFAGPWPVLTVQTAVVGVGYDGTDLNVAWSPAPEATGYTVSVLAAGAATPAASASAGATASSLSFAPGLTDDQKTYSVVVQVRSGQSSGPPSPALDFFAPAWFPSRVPASTAYPYVFPAQTLAQATATTLGQSGPDVVVYLGDVGAGNPLQGLPVTQGPFTLAASGGTTRPYRLTIAGTGAAWTFGASAIRSDLAGDCVEFLKAVENAGGVPWGISQLQLVIARAMPQTFQELLYYSYGLTFPGPGALYGSVDLRPGMVLRVASSDYMAVGGTSSSTWLAGYTGTTVNDYEVGSYQGAGGWMVGMDAFIAQLVANGALTVNPPPTDVSAAQEGGLAESADLFYPSFQQPFYRLFIPSSLLSASQSGSTSTAANFVLAAADNYTALTTSVNVPGGAGAVAYFRGRSVLKVLIRVRLDGSELLVPVGTTVANLLDRLAGQPTSAAAPLVGLELTRSLGPVAFEEAADLDAGRSWPVQLAWDGLQVYGPAWNALSMPLLHGDSLTLQR